MRNIFYIFVMGLLISVVILAVLAKHRTSADLTKEELKKIRRQFNQIIELGNMTCANYDQTCPPANLKRGYYCKQFNKAYICGNHNLENVRQAVAVLERDSPNFVDNWIKDQSEDEVIGE